MIIHEIKQVINFETPHGLGQGLFIIDYGVHENTIWVIALKETREIKHYNSNQIKIQYNYTLNDKI
jgi:hypothetical protein